MLRFVGCDVHKRTAVFTILLEDGRVLATYTVAVTRESLTAFGERQLSAGDRLAMEATSNTWAVAGVLRPFVEQIVIGNPLPCAPFNGASYSPLWQDAIERILIGLSSRAGISGSRAVISSPRKTLATRSSIIPA